MSYASALPAGYKPFRKLVLCSNMLEEVQIPISIGDQPLLLIGAGARPQVWLAAPAKPDSSEWFFVVQANRSRHPSVEVRISGSEVNPSVSIMVAGSRVLRVESRRGGAARVTFLDLRMLGLDVTGDEKILRIGGATFLGNTISKTTIGVRLAGKIAEDRGTVA